MTAPPFARFTLTVDPGAYEVAVAALLELPTAGWQEAEGGGQLVFWLAAALLEDPSVVAVLEHLEALGTLESRPESDDWLQVWRRFHHPVEIGSLVVRPPWAPPGSDAADVVIEIGMAFGTGSHATTRQCLLAMQELPRGSLLDVGTGTGVIALSALRLGYDPVHACDNDELALSAAARNARLNGLAPHLFAADLFAPSLRLPPVDVVIANIALRPILALGESISDGRAGSPDHLLLAGLLVSQADEAAAAFAGYREAGRMRDGEWIALRLERAA